MVGRIGIGSLLRALLLSVVCCTEARECEGDECHAGHLVPTHVVEGSELRADIISQEMDELARLVKLCGDRIELLEELRGALKAGHNLSLPESHVRALSERVPLLSQVVEPLELTPLGSADDYLVSKRLIPQHDVVESIRWLPLRNPRTTGGAASTAQTTMPSALLVAAQPDGNLRLFSPSGEMVHQFHTGHQKDVKFIAMSPSHDEYFMAASDQNGYVRVYKVNVRQMRMSKEQKQARRNSVDGKMSQYLGSQVNVTSQFHKHFQIPKRYGLYPNITAMTIISHQGTKYFVTGDTWGRIVSFTRDGTLHGGINATAKRKDGITNPIVEMHAHLGNLVFRSSVSTELGFANVEKAEVQRINCAALKQRGVQTVIIDAQRTSRLFVADLEGTIWVFDIKERRQCELLHRFPADATGGQVELASLRGVLLVMERRDNSSSAEHSLVALNMSHVGLAKKQVKAAPSPIVWKRNMEQLKSWSVYKRYQQGDLIATLSADGLHIEILESLMQVYMPPQEDFNVNNFKIPLMACAVILFLGYQYMRQTGKLGGDPENFDKKNAQWGGGRSKKKSKVLDGAF